MEWYSTASFKMRIFPRQTKTGIHVFGPQKHAKTDETSTDINPTSFNIFIIKTAHTQNPTATVTPSRDPTRTIKRRTPPLSKDILRPRRVRLPAIDRGNCTPHRQLRMRQSQLLCALLIGPRV